MFSTFFAVRVTSFRMFGHLFMDAKLESDSALDEQIL
jgi:hypothetical protein